MAVGTDHSNHDPPKPLTHLSFPLSFCKRFTVPVLWDKKTHTIVNNESSEIIRMFNTAFNGLLPPDKASIDIYPEQHRGEIDAINEWVYDTVNSTHVLGRLCSSCDLISMPLTRWRVQVWVRGNAGSIREGGVPTL